MLTASESIATSCVAQKKLCNVTTSSSSRKSSCASTVPVITSVTSAIVVQKMIHARRPPHRSSLTRSTSGAQAHLKAQGMNSAAEKAPIASSDTPCWRMNATMATEVNP